MGVSSPVTFLLQAPPTAACVGRMRSRSAPQPAGPDVQIVHDSLKPRIRFVCFGGGLISEGIVPLEQRYLSGPLES